ncbi:MAG: thioesterase domain-containing protein [Bacteroidota bacterium]
MWFNFYNQEGRKPVRLFTFAHSGAGSMTFEPWTSKMEDVEIVGVRLPGRENRMHEKPINDLGYLVNVLTDEIEPYLDQPFCFFGHSFGALLAFELTKSIKAQFDIQPDKLFVSSFRAPFLPNIYTPISSLSDDEIRDSMKRYNGIPKQVYDNEELLRHYIPSIRADFSMHETYQSKLEKVIDCPIVAMVGSEDQAVAVEHVKGWEAMTSSDSCELKIFKGDHFYIKSSFQELTAAVQDTIFEEQLHS